MYKCGNKFCSNPEIRLDFDVRNCVDTITKNHPEWKGACLFQSQGAGCKECGGKMVHWGSGYSRCIECGWSNRS